MIAIADHQQDAVLDGESEQPALVGRRHAGGGHGHGNALNRDHLAHDAGRGVDRRRQDRIQVEGVGGDDLEIAEQARWPTCRCRSGTPRASRRRR